MDSPAKRLLELFPEAPQEASELLKQTLPKIMRHDLAPNPVHYALWYRYSQGDAPALNQRLDKITSDCSYFPNETAVRLFREYIIAGELETCRHERQHLSELVSDIEHDVQRSVSGSRSYQQCLNLGLEALQAPLSDAIPKVLMELQLSTEQMQTQQELFINRLRAAQFEINNLREQLERAQIAANTDSLTRLYNRQAFSQLLEHALTEPHSTPALIMLDIDHFKQFNDLYGHILGDRVLQTVGQLLQDHAPNTAYAARYGGEEFCLILPNCSNIQEAEQLAEHLRQKIQALRVRVRKTDKILDTITASFGIALAEADDSPESLLSRADDALYQAKREGRNRVQLSTCESVDTFD